MVRLDILLKMAEEITSPVEPIKNLGVMPFKRLQKHYDKHRDQVKATDIDDYYNKAIDVMRRGDMHPAKLGRIAFKDPTTKEFVVLDPYDQELVTYFIRRAYLEGL